MTEDEVAAYAAGIRRADPRATWQDVAHLVNLALSRDADPTPWPRQWRRGPWSTCGAEDADAAPAQHLAGGADNAPMPRDEPCEVAWDLLVVASLCAAAGIGTLAERLIAIAAELLEGR